MLRKLLLASAFAAVIPLVPAFAQSAPYTNPTYIPNSVLAAQSYTTNSTGDYTFVVQNNASVAFQVTGSPSGLVAAFQGSVDGTNYVTLTGYPMNGGAAITSVTGTGAWRVQSAGFTKVRLHITAHTSGTFAVSAVGAQASSLVQTTSNDTASDPCQNPSVVKSSAVLNVGEATTTKIVDATASQKVYVCSFSFSLAGTTPSFTFKTGTHGSADCDTSAAALSGVYLPTTGLINSMGGSGVLMTSITSGQICGTTVGTNSSAQGILTYVKQ